MSNTKAFNICDTLRKRLQEINNKKEDYQKKINVSSEQLQKLFARGGKSSRQTPEQLDAQIDELEKKRTSSSLPLAQEKEILRQISQIKKAKVQYEENKVHEKAIQQKKSEISNYRTELTTIKAQIAELEAALSKVELADRLGCTANDLKSHMMECPEGKLGQVIGKGGSNIKKLENKTGCLIDLDKVKSQIHLQGNESSISKAIQEIEDITMAIEVEMKLDQATLSFLFSNHMTEFSSLQKKYPNVIFDLSRETSMLKLRGREEYVDPAKEEVLKNDVTMQSIETSSRDAALIVGKSGKTINRLIETHGVAIQVENRKDDMSEIIVSGLQNQVVEAINEIKDILFNNEDMEVSLLVSAMTRNKLLSNSGLLVKKLQKDVNAACQPGNSFVRFEELPKEERETSSILLVKSPRMHIKEAEKIVRERIEEYDSAVLTMQIDLDLIPVIIGPKGATIKAIRKEGGDGSDLEIDKFSGEVKLMAEKESSREKMKSAIDAIVSENQIMRLPMEKSMFADLFGQSGKVVKAKIQNNGVFMRIDDSDTSIILRGSIEKITEAAEDIREFIASNQTKVFPIDNDDESFLSRRNGLVKKIEKRHNVRLNLKKDLQVVSIKGAVEGINDAEKELKKTLFGGDGFTVEKMFVPNTVMGAIIGKGGKNISKYESDFDPVMVTMHSLSFCLSIRGPSDQVELCRRKIAKDIVECKVTESIQIDTEAFSKLSQAAQTSAIGGLPVNLNVSQTSVRLRGAFGDVQEVMKQVKELITGTCVAEIFLTPDHFEKTSKAVEDSSKFEQICESTTTSASLDESLGAVVITGKRSNVKRAKTMMLGFLETVAPTGIAKIKFLKPLLKSMGSSKDVAKLSMDSGCIISLERDICTFFLQAPSSNQLKDGMEAVESTIKECMKLTNVFQVESWLLQYLLTKSVESIEMAKKECDCQIELSRNELMISISGKEEAEVSKAKSMIDTMMDQAKKENVFIDIPESSMNEFSGTSGRRMRGLASKYGVHIDRVKKTKSRIHIQGSGQSLIRAVNAVNEWVANWEKKNGGVTLVIEEDMINHVASESSILNDIQKEFGVKADLNKKNCSVTIRGGKTTATREKASLKLESLMQEISEKDGKGGNKENEVIAPADSNTTYVNGEDPMSKAPIEEVEPPEMTQKSQNNAIGSLYNLLVSDDVASSVIASDVQEWDSSTVSSGLESEIESPETGVSYYRSASGFHVRL